MLGRVKQIEVSSKWRMVPDRGRPAQLALLSPVEQDRSDDPVAQTALLPSSAAEDRRPSYNQTPKRQTDRTPAAHEAASRSASARHSARAQDYSNLSATGAQAPQQELATGEVRLI